MFNLLFSQFFKLIPGPYSHSPLNDIFLEITYKVKKGHTGSPHFTRFHFARSSLYTRFIIVPNEFTLCNALHDFLTLHCQKTLSELYLSTKGSVFHFTRISLYTIYFEKQKSCKVRATCTFLFRKSGKMWQGTFCLRYFM